MDPLTLAMTTATVLAPYLVKVGEKTAEKIGELVPAGVGALWMAISRRLKGRAAAEEAVADLMAAPDDEMARTVFANQVKKVLDAEPVFVAELAELLAGLQQDGGDRILNRDAGIIATRRSVIATAGSVAAGGGSAAIGGNVYGSVVVGVPPHDPTEALVTYRRVLAESCRHFSLRGLDLDASDPAGTLRQFDLAQIYVELLTTTQVPVQKADSRRKSQRDLLDEQRETRPLSAVEAVGSRRWAVILGDPGSGKSTFLSHLALCLAVQGGETPRDRATRLDGWPTTELDTLPVLVTLRAFARSLPRRSRKAEARHLWEFLTEQLTAQNLGFVVDLLHERLDRGQVILLFDGLDEIPTPQQRAFVRDAVQAFARRYSRCRMVVTCRTLSYQDPAVRLDEAQEFTLAPFTEEQIDRFIVAWYGELVRMRSIKPEARAGMTQRLHEAVRRPDLQRLSSNPLLLSAMALVHAHKGQLPDARALLYEETIDILLWRWDQLKTEDEEESPRLRTLLMDVGRGEADLKKVLWQLAFTAHEQGGTGDGETVADIGEAQLEKALSQLHPERSKDWAKQVLDVIKLRAGLLLERASEIYTFPHRTFQEYLAGAYLASKPSFAQPVAQLAAAGALWREVILLAVGRLVYRDAETDKPLALVAELCPTKREHSDVAWRQTWLAGDVLVEMGVNRATDRVQGRELVERVRCGLVDLLRGSHLSTVERARAGDTLARLGDPRFCEECWYLPAEELLGFVLIPAGPFEMGSNKKHDSQADEEETRQHTLSLPDYYISRYPVTVGQFGAFVEDKPKVRPHDPRSLKGLANHPVRYVSWHEAVAYCEWLTKTLRQWDKTPELLARLLREGWEVALPSEAEWEKAARGTEGWIYPWGNDWYEDHANTEEAGIGRPSAVGCFPQGASRYGCQDMAGNVWEWTRSLWGKDVRNPEFGYPYQANDQRREDLAASDNVLRVLRGGGCWNTQRVARCADRVRFAPNHRNVSVGFRVVVRPCVSSGL